MNPKSFLRDHLLRHPLRHPLRHLAAGLVAGVLLAPALAPACAAELTGRVTDAETGDPIPLVGVELTPGDPARQTITTMAGEYRFEVPPGRYILTLTHVAYRKETRPVTVTRDLDTRLDVTLRAAATVLEPVEVIGNVFAEERRRQTGYIGLEAKTLTALPGLGENDVIRALQFLPGVQAASDVSSGLYVRGGGPDQTLILLDRFTLYNPTHAFGLFSTFNGDAIDDVSLYKGAYPATYGGRLGAVLDVRQRLGDERGVKGRASISTVAGNATVEGPLEGGSWMLSGRRTYLDPILAAIRTDENPVPDYYFYDLNGRFRLGRGPSGRLDASVYVSRDDLLFDLDEESGFELTWGNTAASVGYQATLGDAVATAALSVSDYRSTSRVEFFSTPILFDNRVRDYTLRGDVSVDVTSDHELGIGAELSRYEFGFVQSFNRGSRVERTSTPWGGALYVQDEWTPGERWNVRTGLRGRYFEEGDRYFLEPRLGLSFAVRDDVILKGGAGIYNQVLQLVASEGFSGTDFYLPIDGTTDPGRSLQSVLGVDWDLNETYRSSAEVYYTDLDDVVIYDNETAADQPGTTSEDLFVTGGQGYATGLELFLERRRGAVTGWIGYTLGWTRRQFEEVNAGDFFPPKYDRRHDLNVVLNLDRGAWRYGASFVYATGQAFTPAAARYGIRDPATGQVPDGGQVLPAERNSARLLPYHRLDVSVTKDFSLFGRDAQWFVNVFNVYSRRNDWFVELDPENESEPEIVKQLPIIPSLGVRVEF